MGSAPSCCTRPRPARSAPAPFGGVGNGIAHALSFFLGALLLHPSAVEAATSAMEVVAVSGANAALLVAQRIGGAQRRQGGGGDGHDKVAPRDEL